VTAFVLDNSVAMRWCFDSATHPYADAILKRFAVSDTAVVPLLWFFEASAVLARAQNTGILTAARADAFIAELKSLPILADDEGPRRALSDIHRLALTYRLTSYDASYLELALRRGLPLASLDEDLVKASRAAGVPVIAQASP
jgi:predicted nucleic acid-binding protein